MKPSELLLATLNYKVAQYAFEAKDIRNANLQAFFQQYRYFLIYFRMPGLFSGKTIFSFELTIYFFQVLFKNLNADRLPASHIDLTKEKMYEHDAGI